MEISNRELKVTVSGSFTRHLACVQKAVEDFQARGAMVLSPADPMIVDRFGGFLFVASDRRRSIKGVQSRHLAAIGHSDFLWLCCGDGYVGQSAAMEIGYAAAEGVPIYADAAPSDLTLRQYVTVVNSPKDAISFHAARRLGEPASPGTLLLDPHGVVSEIHDQLEKVEARLMRTPSYSKDDPVEASVNRIERLLQLPSRR